LEHWNVGLETDISPILECRQREFCLEQYSIFPLFQHSNQGEARTWVLGDHIPNRIHLARDSGLNFVNYFTISKPRIELIVSIHTKIFPSIFMQNSVVNFYLKNAD
jgi:hypothetical protein